MASITPATPGHHAARIVAALLATIAFSILLAANLPYQYIDMDESWSGAVHMDYRTPFRAYRKTPVMAGWPLTYLVQYDDDGETLTRLWSWPKLIVDVIVLLALPAIVTCLMLLRERFDSKTSRGWWYRKVCEFGVLGIFIGIPLGYAGWQVAKTNAHHRAARYMGRFGNVSLSCWLPRPLVKHVPESWIPFLHRIRDVHVLGTDARVAYYLQNIDTMVAFHGLREKVDPDVIHLLADDVHLQALQLSYVDLDESHIQQIADMPWLRQISLTRTNLTPQMLRQLDHVPFKSVDIAVTDVPMSQLGRPEWSETVEQLTVSRPPSGSDSITIDGWPRLKDLSISRFTLNLNHDVVDVHLANLPSLEAFTFNRSQKHRMRLHHLPRLLRLDEGMGNNRFIMSFSEWIPGGTWVTELELHDVPSLTSFSIFAGDLQTLSIRDAPNLASLSIGAYRTRAMGYLGWQLLPVDAQRCQQWIDFLGQQNGPSTLDFTGLPLDQIDLAPLAKNKKIRHLNLESTGIEFEQLRPLGSMKQLESLDIRTCRVNDEQMQWLLSEFPELEKLSIDGTSLRTVDLHGALAIRQLTTTPLQNLHSLRILDQPDLVASLRIDGRPEEITIRNATSLEGLAVEGIWPRDCKVTGLRDLQWFAGGGQAIDDALLTQLLECQELNQLTLAYPSISSDQLAQIGRFTALTLLAVPGAAVDDSVTKRWQTLESLWEVDLSDTTVDANTIGWLSRLESLRRVHLNRVPLSEDAIGTLSELRQITELQIAGVEITTEQLATLLRTTNLMSLNISGTRIDESLAEVLAADLSLKHLIINGEDIDESVLTLLLAENDRLYVDFNSPPSYLHGPLEEILVERVAKAQSEFRIAWQDMLTGLDALTVAQSNQADDESQEVAQLVSLRMPNIGGRIDPAVFRLEPPTVVSTPPDSDVNASDTR